MSKKSVKWPTPGQVYWGAKQQRMAVVYEVKDRRVKLVGIGMGPWAYKRIKRITWPNGVPSTWALYQDI